MKNYELIARTLVSIDNCHKAGNNGWLEKHEATLADVIACALSGSGIDNGTELDRDVSSDSKLVFHADYHHMSEHGFYDGWTEHKVIITPSLSFGFTIRVTGRNRNEIKECLAEVYGCWLQEEVEE